MSITQPTTGRSSSDNLGCPRCNALLPAQAMFCGICGERIDKIKFVPTSQSQKGSHTVEDSDIATHYRITSLVRRRPYVNLFFALDNKQQRMVAIRDIDTSSLDEETRANAIELVESEYDLLRRSHIPYIMSVIDLRHFQNHLFVITSGASQWPTGSSYNANESPVATELSGSDGQFPRLYTLQDVLQSGIGLPPEQVALDWVNHLCQTLDNLHQQQIVIGDLDPYTIILNSNSYDSQPVLMVSWLPPQLRNLLPRTFTTTNMSYFSAPEAIVGNAEPRSDIYSLGSILYLLLTGTPPDEPTWREGSGSHPGETVHPQRGVPSQSRQRLRSVRELNPHISSGIDACIMRALSMDPLQRFQHGEEMAEALRRGRAFEPIRITNSDANWESPTQRKQSITGYQDRKETEDVEEIANVDTVRIVPLSQKNLERWQSSRLLARNLIPRRPKTIPSTPQLEEPVQGSPKAFPDPLAETEMPTLRTMGNATFGESPYSIEDLAEAGQNQTQLSREALIHETEVTSSYHEDVWFLPPTPPGSVSLPGSRTPTLPQRMKQWITGKLPALISSLGADDSSRQQAGTRPDNIAHVSPPTLQSSAPSLSGQLRPSEAETSFLKQIQRFVLGQQQHTTTAAAIIETPLRVQPNQEYAIRLHLIGRDEIAFPPGSNKDMPPSGLSALIHGELVCIEVRSALPQNFAYLVQRAAVRIPAHGYEAEVTIPIQPLPIGPGGRRDRLHILFMDEQRRPLYEKSFVVEIFISTLVQPGREGHNVLTIPF